MKWLDEMIDRVNAGGISGEWATQSQVAASSAVDKLELPAIPDDAVVDLVGCLIDELDRLREWVAAVEDGYDKQKAEIERLKAYTDAYNTLLAERVEIECLRGLAIRAWHSFRSGLSATGGCLDGLTDGDILELVRLSNVEAAKLRGHDSVTATIAEAERQAKIPRIPNEREDEPIE